VVTLAATTATATQPMRMQKWMLPLEPRLSPASEVQGKKEKKKKKKKTCFFLFLPVWYPLV